MNHTITESELDEWLRKPQWHIYASSGVRAGGAKRLEIDIGANGRAFRVTCRGDTIFLGADQAAAVAAYNTAR